MKTGTLIFRLRRGAALKSDSGRERPSVVADAAARITGFPPILGVNPQVLILGSMPSVASLEKQHYYGKPQNAFWRIMGELFGAGPEIAYEQRTQLLVEQGVAVWDVLASCVRPGSLDSAIQPATEVVNDFAGLLREHASIAHIFFNGRKAETVFRKRAVNGVGQVRSNISYTSLPSTSPAMASLDFAAKLERWQVVRDVIQSGTCLNP